MTGDKVAVVAVYTVLGDATVNGCGAAAGVVVLVTLRGSTELLRAICISLAVARSTVCPWLVALLLLLFTADDDGFWNIGRGGVFTMLIQLSPIAGDDRPSREETPSGRGERKAGLPESAEKSVLCGQDDLVSPAISSICELSRSATWPSELTPAHALHSPALERESEPVYNERRCWLL